MQNKEAQLLWSRCLALIKKKIPNQSFRTWFAPIVPHKYEHHTLTIHVPNSFFYEWLESEYANLLREVIHKELGPQGRLSYQVVATKKVPTETLQADKKIPQKKHTTQKIRLNPLYTFDHFVVWDGNELAQAASLAVSKKPGKTSFNPLMIHSPVGLGKTHLLHAIAYEMKKNNKDSRFFYTTAEDFTAGFIRSLRNNEIQEFTNFYLDLDMLLVDDVHSLADKKKTQDLFFNIFNHLYQNGKQIVMTSDCPPSDLVGFPRRLVSRFRCGLTADMPPPDLETRIAIVQAKLDQNQFKLSHDLILLIAESITTSVREIEGAVTSLVAYASLNKKAINAKLVEQVIHNIAEEVEKPVFNISYLQKVVADYYKVPLEGIKGRSRKRELSTARHVAMYLARSLMSDTTLQVIGHSFGRRDHSTVNYGIKSIEGLQSTDRKVRKDIDEIRKQLARHTKTE